MKTITGSLFTDWQWLLQPCQIDASVFKSSSQDVKQMTEAKKMYTVEQCGQECPSLHWLETFLWKNSQKEWKRTSSNLGTVRHTPTQSYLSTDVNQARGLQKSQESFTQRDISSLWTTPKAKSQMTQPNTNRVMLWC